MLGLAAGANGSGLQVLKPLCCTEGFSVFCFLVVLKLTQPRALFLAVKLCSLVRSL